MENTWSFDLCAGGVYLQWSVFRIYILDDDWSHGCEADLGKVYIMWKEKLQNQKVSLTWRDEGV